MILFVDGCVQIDIYPLEELRCSVQSISSVPPVRCMIHGSDGTVGSASSIFVTYSYHDETPLAPPPGALQIYGPQNEEIPITTNVGCDAVTATFVPSQSGLYRAVWRAAQEVLCMLLRIFPTQRREFDCVLVWSDSKRGDQSMLSVTMVNVLDHNYVTVQCDDLKIEDPNGNLISVVDGESAGTFAFVPIIDGVYKVTLLCADVAYITESLTVTSNRPDYRTIYAHNTRFGILSKIRAPNMIVGEQTAIAASFCDTTNKLPLSRERMQKIHLSIGGPIVDGSAPIMTALPPLDYEPGEWTMYPFVALSEGAYCISIMHCGEEVASAWVQAVRWF